MKLFFSMLISTHHEFENNLRCNTSKANANRWAKPNRNRTFCASPRTLTRLFSFWEKIVFVFDANFISLQIRKQFVKHHSEGHRKSIDNRENNTLHASSWARSIYRYYTFGGWKLFYHFQTWQITQEIRVYSRIAAIFVFADDEEEEHYMVYGHVTNKRWNIIQQNSKSNREWKPPYRELSHKARFNSLTVVERCTNVNEWLLSARCGPAYKTIQRHESTVYKSFNQILLDRDVEKSISA